MKLEMVDILDLQFGLAQTAILVYDPANGHELRISSGNVIHFISSVSPEAAESLAIADIEVKTFVESEVRTVLIEYGYGFTIYPEIRELHHLHAEASLCIDVFATKPFAIERV